MPDETQILPEFDSLHAALYYGFDEIQRESDPFRRLAWLIERQESYFRQTNRRSRVSELLGLSDTEVLLEDCEKVLRDYHELRCEPDFPRQLIQQGLTAATRKEFLAVLGEIERGDSDFGIDLDNGQVLDEIEYWLGFKLAGLMVQQPVNGLTVVLSELHQARNRLNGSETSRADVLGQVTNAFVQAETLLRQLFAFYGRVFYGLDYIGEMISQYERERTIPSVGSETRQRLASESGWLKAYVQGKWQLDFGNYCRLLHRFDRWIGQAVKSPRDDEEQERGLKFKEIFDRERLFPGQQEVGSVISVPVKEGNSVLMKNISIQDGFTSPFIAILYNLNPLRSLYVHEDDPNFIHPSNIENIRNGAMKILDTFIDLWSSIQDTIFPSVVLVRRLLQIEPNVVRIDYVPETGSHLACVRVATADLPSDVDVSQLLGQEAFLYTRDEQGGMASVLLLYPIE